MMNTLHIEIPKRFKTNSNMNNVSDKFKFNSFASISSKTSYYSIESKNYSVKYKFP